MKKALKYVIGPDGSPLTLADLPPPNGRWMSRRKTTLVAAIRGGVISLSDAAERYKLTTEELLEWCTALDEHGQDGLRTSKQKYRDKKTRRRPEKTHIGEAT